MSDKPLVDVVDQKDKPTGRKVSNDEAHDRGLLHRVSAVHVFLPNGKLLVQVHKWHGHRLDHSVGGHVDSGEDYLAAAKREMSEELGLDAPLTKVAESVISIENYPEWGSKIRHMFGVFTTTAPVNWYFIPNDEVDQLLEMELEEIVDMMNTQPEKFLKGFMVSLDAYLRSINSPLIIKGRGQNWGEL